MSAERSRRLMTSTSPQLSVSAKKSPKALKSRMKPLRKYRKALTIWTKASRNQLRQQISKPIRLMTCGRSWISLQMLMAE